MSDKIKMVPALDPRYMPREVEDWCIDQDMSTHYATEMYQVKNTNNKLVKWLKKEGYEPPKGDFFWVGIFGT